MKQFPVACGINFLPVAKPPPISMTANDGSTLAKSSIANPHHTVRFAFNTQSSDKRSIDEYATEIRQEQSLFFAYMQSFRQLRRTDPDRARRLHKQAMHHGRNAGELLLSVWGRFATAAIWMHWLRNQCMMHESFAVQYMQLASQDDDDEGLTCARSNETLINL